MVQKLHAALRHTTLTVVLLVTLSACVSEQEAITGISSGGSSNSPPSLSGNPANAVQIGDPFLFQPSASDPDGDVLSFTIQNRPGWAEFDATSGRVSGMPLLGDEGVYGDITISVSDGSDTSSLAFSVTVTGNSGGGSPNSPPSLSGNPANSVKIGDSYLFQPNASDSDGDALSFTIQNRPGWAEFDATSGRVSGMPLLGDEGVYGDITISVSDGSDTSSLAFSVTVTSIGSASVTLSWTPPTENEDGTALTDLAGYNIYYGDSAGTYPNWIRIDNPGMSTYVVGNLTPKTYYFVATSFNAMGIESRYSNEAVKVAN